MLAYPAAPVAALRIVACTGALLSVLFVAPAGAAVRPGVYQGRADDGARVSLRVGAGGTRVTRFTVRRLRMRCSDGDVFRTGFLSSRRPARIGRGGRFASEVRYADGGRLTVRGRLGDSRASGSLRLRVRFNDNDDAVPNGRIRCDSGRRKFSVRASRQRDPNFTG